jgi:hypothetical protein
MDKKAQYDLMEKIGRELEDLKNSQTSVLKKISQIEADNINLNNKTLEDRLVDIFDKVDQNLSLVTALCDEFLVESEAFKKQHNLDQIPDVD